MEKILDFFLVLFALDASNMGNPRQRRASLDFHSFRVTP